MQNPESTKGHDVSAIARFLNQAKKSQRFFGGPLASKKPCPLRRRLASDYDSLAVFLRKKVPTEILGIIAFLSALCTQIPKNPAF